MFWFHTTSGIIVIWEQRYRLNGVSYRPLRDSLRVTPRGMSPALSRRASDFAVDGSYANAKAKLKEHYGLDLSISTIMGRTQKVAKEIRAMEPGCPPVKKAKAIVAQIDGSMVSTVESDPAQPDKRKFKRRSWKETKLATASIPGSTEKVYGGGTISGGVTAAGQGLLSCVERLGLGKKTHVYGVSDGAPWIADQFELLFGENHTFLVDLYHVCEHLAEAAPAFVTSEDKDAIKQWVSEQKERLKKKGPKGVIKTLESKLEPARVLDENAPVRRCHRYFVNRPGQFDYPAAIENNVPVGSGAIESGNRSVIQERMKKPGASWLVENAEDMIALRVFRANGDWATYWESKMAA